MEMIPIRIAMAAVIQSGDKTHTHDHVITLRSFKIINTMVNNPLKPISA
jgi:hypothetical protein